MLNNRKMWGIRREAGALFSCPLKKLMLGISLQYQIIISDMKKFYKSYCLKNLPFHIFSACAIILMAASFIVPPLGVIDASVLAGVGELFGFAALGAVYKAIDNGTDARITKGSMSIEIDNKDKREEE